MIIKTNFSNDELSKLHDFKYKYYELYPVQLQKEIDNNLFLGFTNNEDTINQIYCYLNLIKDDINPYRGFQKFLDKTFNIKHTKSILEVGSGSIPILSHLIENKYKTKVDIQDPITLFANYNKGNIFKEEFDENTDISNYDLIIGYNPCEASEAIIRNAIKSKKNFSIALCSCCHLPHNYKEKSSEIWHNYLLDIAKRLGKDNYKIKIAYFPESYHLNDPIITGIHKKSTHS